MIYSDMTGNCVSRLGFGGMRFPLLEDGRIDEAQVREMVAAAIAGGVNYFDTAYPYHGGDSERVLGRILAEYPRESWLLASKYPGHQLFSEGHDPAGVFEKQLEKCGVDYFDFYLLHNVYEGSLATYLDPEIGIIEYFKEQKRRGRIKHLGFSTHAQTQCLRKFLDLHGADMEFCQIQLNYLDWTLQDGKAKYELLTERGVPIVVMEPLRGGRLATLSDDQMERLRSVWLEEKPAALSFRFLQDLPNVRVVLSGMSNVSQIRENVAAFAGSQPLSADERALLLDLAEEMKESVPCTACRYCCDDCPAGLDIPYLLEVYNNMRFAPSTNVAMSVEFMDPEKRPEKCTACGACSRICPQGIDVPTALADLVERIGGVTPWASVCVEREAAAKRG
ncbi:MAG: aldo/keto reductase [Eggerthellaceae bacterium]|nr:aldo/keto reductase [Eggerthellaceae bacterium]